MTTQRKFLLDADTFMSAHRQYYRFSFCPAYWRALLVHHASKRLASIEQVRKELLRGKDALTTWVENGLPLCNCDFRAGFVRGTLSTGYEHWVLIEVGGIYTAHGQM